MLYSCFTHVYLFILVYKRLYTDILLFFNAMEGKECLECSVIFYGRSDKKFCGDLCRNVYNNRLKCEENQAISQVNQILRKNRKILAELLNGKQFVIFRKDKLLSKGFNFTYFTNTFSTNQGLIYFYCYDLGYLYEDNDMIKIMLKKEYVG